MLSKNLQLHLIAALITALAAFLVSCPAENQAADPNAQTTVQGTQNPAIPAENQAAAQSEPGQSNNIVDSAVDEPAGGESSTSNEASDEKAKAEDEVAEEKPPMSKNYRPPKEESPRPIKKPSRKKSFVYIEFRMLSAEYNENEDATLSKLELEFRANTGRMKRQIQTVVLDDINTLVATDFDLGLCRIEIYPIVQQPELDDIGSLGSVELLFKGMFQIRLYLEDDELIGIFGIYSDGTFGAAPMEERPEGFRVKSTKLANSYAPEPFTVYRKTDVGNKPEYLVTIQYNGGGFDEETVEDPKGHRYKYRFPAGRLELFDPNEK